MYRGNVLISSGVTHPVAKEAYQNQQDTLKQLNVVPRSGTPGSELAGNWPDR